MAMLDYFAHTAVLESSQPRRRRVEPLSASIAPYLSLEEVLR